LDANLGLTIDTRRTFLKWGTEKWSHLIARKLPCISEFL
jgi:hypothetical protein